MLRTIHLYGQLADMAGTNTFELDVDTPVMLVAGLNSALKGFRAWSAHHKLAYVLTDPENEVSSLTVEDFRMPLGDATDIHLIPKVEGAGVEIAAYIVAEFAITSAIAIAAVYIATYIAIAVVLGAVAQALAPSPDTSGGQAKADERPSFLYNGPVNVVEQGYAVPLVYGTHMTGSVVISAGVTVEDIPYIPPEPAVGSSGPPTEDWQYTQFVDGA